MESPRAHRDSKIVAAKLERLRDPHIAPITDLVDEIRAEVGHDHVPYVDPTLAGVDARVMFLLETPARPAALGSTMLSPDNDDTTAANVWKFYRESGLRRDRAIHWNAVPWFMGTKAKNKNATRDDIVGGLPWLARMIDLLPRLSLVVTMGEIARRVFALHLLRPEVRLFPWLSVAHPSGRVRNSQPLLWEDIQQAFSRAAEVARDGRA